MLLDTHVVVGLSADKDRMGPVARRRIAGAPVVHVSAASVWQAPSEVLDARR